MPRLRGVAPGHSRRQVGQRITVGRATTAAPETIINYH